MQKWVRRSFHASLAAGAMGLAAANLAAAEEPRVEVDSSSASVTGDNGIGSGNAASAPVVAGVIDNQVALSHLIVGLGDATNLGPGGECSIVVDSEAVSATGDNHAAGGNAVSAPVVAAIAGNEVASTFLGDSFNSGEACDGGAAGPPAGVHQTTDGDMALAGQPEFNEQLLPIGSLPLNQVTGIAGSLPLDSVTSLPASLPLDSVTGVAGSLPLGSLTGALGGLPVGDIAGTLPVGGLGGVLGNPTALVGTVTDLVGLGGLGGLAGLGGLPLSGVTGGLPVPLSVDEAPAPGAEIATGEQDAQTSESTESAELSTSDSVATELAGNGEQGSTVDVTSESLSVTGDNTIASGNSVSAPVVASVLENQIAAAIVGDATNEGAAGNDLLGLLE